MPKRKKTTQRQKTDIWHIREKETIESTELMREKLRQEIDRLIEKEKAKGKVTGLEYQEAVEKLGIDSIQIAELTKAIMAVHTKIDAHLAMKIAIEFLKKKEHRK